MEIPELHRRSVDFFDSNMHALKDAQLQDPTPCTEWSVRDLVNHVVNEDLWTPDLLSGKTVEEVGDAYDGDLLGDDPLGAWHDASRKAVEAVGGVSDFEQPVNVSWGQIPAREYVTQLILDHAVHGWDLGKAIGADTQIDHDLVSFLWSYVEANEELIRGSGAFGDPQSAADDNQQNRLLAALGRQP